MKNILSLLLFSLALSACAQIEPYRESQKTTLLELKRKAAKDDPEANYMLGLYYQDGKKTFKDQPKATQYLRQAAAKEHKEAQEKLLQTLTSSKQSQDQDEAQILAKKLAAKTNAEATFQLAKNALNRGEKEKAFELFQQAANLNHKEAMVQLGRSYLDGVGVEKEQTKALPWLEKAANQGEKTAQELLGYMYFDGIGVIRDTKKSKEWYQKAEGQNSDFALNALGGIALGEGDTGGAKVYYLKAARLGNADALYNLGQMCEKGQEFRKDMALARRYYREAANKNNKQAKQALARLK